MDNLEESSDIDHKEEYENNEQISILNQQEQDIHERRQTISLQNDSKSDIQSKQFLHLSLKLEDQHIEINQTHQDEKSIGTPGLKSQNDTIETYRYAQAINQKIINKKNLQKKLDQVSSSLESSHFVIEERKTKKKKSQHKDKQGKIVKKNLGAMKLPEINQIRSGRLIPEVSPNNMSNLEQQNQNKQNFYKQHRDEPHNLQIFDQIDNIIVKQQQYLNKNKQNYERALVKLFKLDGIKSERAQLILEEINKTRVIQMKNLSSKRKKQKFVDTKIDSTVIIDRNQSLQSRNTVERINHQRRSLSKQQIQNSTEQLNQIQEEMNRISSSIDQHQINLQQTKLKADMNKSTFKFQQSVQDQYQGSDKQWERLTILDAAKIKSKLSTFDLELDKVNEYFTRNESCMGQYLQIQETLINYKNQVLLSSKEN